MKKPAVPRRYLRGVQTHNFKGFKENQEIEFAPKVNLIFGKNSTGKSSIFQTIRLFRQSYQSRGLTPINFEIPQEFRDRGGINLDIGYPGVINDLDIKKKLTLGLSTGIFPIPSGNKPDFGNSSLAYTFKYVKNFYKEKDLSSEVNRELFIKDKTVLDSITIKKGMASYKILFKKTVIFKEGSNVEKKLKVKTTRRAFREVEKTEYKSIYPPYYYNVQIDKKSIPDSFIEQTYKDFFLIKKDSLHFLSLVATEIDKRIKKGKGLKKTVLHSDYAQIDKSQKKYEAFKKTLTKKNHHQQVEERIKWMIKNYKDITDLYFTTVTGEIFGFQLDHYKVFKKSIETIVEKFRNINKENFKKTILSDIEKKTSHIIYFKGEFAIDPLMKKVDYVVNRKIEDFLPFTLTESNFFYLFNIIQMTIKDDGQLRFFEPYSVARPGPSILNDVNRCTNKMYIMPGLRTLPKKYYVKGLQTDYVGPQAENLAEFLANTKMRKTANDWLKKLEIPYEIDVKKIDNYYSIVFKPNSSSSKVSISQTHIGLGFPLIMPFVVQCIKSENQILLAEEPEVHLHPKLEADLADLIIWSANTRRNQFIIETHSEDFLLRLLKHVRKKRIKSDEITANYITNVGKEGSKVRRVLINEHGQYTINWKDNMFVERMEEFK